MMPDPIGTAARWVGAGGLLAYPTETVWGLGADACSDQALERLLRWKGRGPGEPVAMLVESIAAAAELGFEFGPAAQRLARAFWPGPLTLVLWGPEGFARGLAREDGAVGLRCSSHPLAQALARRLSREGFGPITATSFNRSGEPAACNVGEARALCGEGPEDVRLIDVEGAEAGGGDTSTVVDVTAEAARVLRWGALGEQELGPVLQEIAAP